MILSQLIFSNDKIYRKIAIIAAAAITSIVILDLLATRQILPIDSIAENIIFILTVFVAYGIGSLILFSWSNKITQEIRKKSLSINIVHYGTWMTQFLLLVIMTLIIFFNGPVLLNSSVYLISSISSTLVLGLISWKLFRWYRPNEKNLIILVYGLAAFTLGTSVAVDAYSKLILVQVIEEPTPVDATLQSSFLYRLEESGKILYQDIGKDITRIYLLPTVNISLYHYLNLIPITISFVFRWIATIMILKYHYQKIGHLSLILWIILYLPLVLYLVGKIPDFLELPSDYQYRFYFRILFRIGTIAGSVLFGLAFYIIGRHINSEKIKDYLASSAIGLTIVGLSLSTSALQQTYGIAGHSLILVSSYLFSLGLYASAVSLLHDLSLRRIIKRSTMELLNNIGKAEIEDKIRTKVIDVSKNHTNSMLNKTGIVTSFETKDINEYMNSFTKQIDMLYDVDEIIEKEKEILKSSFEYCACSRIGALKLGYYNYFDIFERINEKHLHRSHKGIKIVTSIDNTNLQIVKKFMESGVNVRHVKNMPPIDFALSDKEMIATLEKVRGEKTIKNLLVTNEPAYLEHFNSFFNELWNNGVDAKIRIGAIEEGIDSEGIEIIQDPFEVQKIGIELVNSANKEILIIFSTQNAFHRQEQIGMMQYLKKAIGRQVRIRILTPFDESITEMVETLDRTIMFGDNISSGPKQFEIRSIERQLQTRVTILIVDGRFSLVVELKDDSQKSSYEAMGVATYSNSKPTVISYVSIFESMWLLTELNQKLILQDRAQKEFVDIAAHELRTPIQPIIGLSEILSLKLDNPEHHQLVEGIIRNAKRLQRITEDILDVTRIESRSLRLNKQIINLVEVIREAIEDYSDHITENRKIIFSGTDVYIDADKEKILQVVSNLLNNALKFTRQGKIEASVEVIGSMAVTRIIDEGTGIDAAILPRLFTKFCTKSANGTGLGLYISKNIIQAHGGTMWGENNFDGTGATFYFSLPVVSSKMCLPDQ